MFVPKQLDLIEEFLEEPPDEIQRLKAQFDELKESCDNVRKRLFAENRDLKNNVNIALKKNVELEEAIASLKEDLAKVRELMIKRTK